MIKYGFGFFDRIRCIWMFLGPRTLNMLKKIHDMRIKGVYLGKNSN